MKKFFLFLIIVMLFTYSCDKQSINELSDQMSSKDESAYTSLICGEKLEILVLKAKNNFFLTEDIKFIIDTNTKTATAVKGIPHPNSTPLIFDFVLSGGEAYHNEIPLESAITSVILGNTNTIIIEDGNGAADEYNLIIPDSSKGVAVVFINTDNYGIIESNVYRNGTFTVLSPYGNTISSPAGIRLRGNSTLSLEKKSYRIKLNKKADVLNFGSGRNWVLLANHADKSLLRNMGAFYLSSILDGINYTPAITPAEVYLNGEYIGLYTLGHHIQVKSDRVDVEEGSTEADTGYLIECDVRAREENRPYFEIDGMLFSVLSPEEPTDGQVKFITDYVNKINTMIKNRDSELWDYLDMASCIDWLITKEVCGATGMGYDAYLYRDKGGKLCFGPVWDFDLAYGNADFGDAHLSDRFYLIGGSWFSGWFNCGDFAEKFLKRWEEAKSVYIPQMKAQIMTYYEEIKVAAQHNFERWDILNSYVWPNPPLVMSKNTHKEQVELLIRYIDEHVAFMDKEFDKYR